MKRMVNYLLILLFSLAPSFLVYNVSPTVAEAKICPPGQYAERTSSNTFVCKGSKTNNNAVKKKGIESWKSYIKAFSVGLAGLALGLAVLMTAYSGFLYTTSEGDAEKIKKAKFHLIMAGGGMMMALLTFVIAGILEKVIIS